jgi:uncharacterized protein
VATTAQTGPLAARLAGRLTLDRERLAAFCRRWEVTELALFGSVLRADFGPGSDVDVLVAFAPAARPSLFDLVEMETELADLLGREVDLVTRRSVEESDNWIRRRAILASAVPLPVAVAAPEALTGPGAADAPA